jgi:hypothetical protein
MGRKEIEYDNSRVVKALEPYQTWTQAAREYRFLDHILTGLANLDHDGNSRPLGMPMLYTLLSTLPVISTAAVREATGFKKSHGSTVRKLLELAASEFEAQLAIRAAMAPAPAVAAPARWAEAKSDARPSKRPATVPDLAPAQPPPSPQALLLFALERCREAHGRTLYTALRAYHGDIGAVLAKVLGDADNRELVEAGVLLVDHDTEATARKPPRQPPRLKQQWQNREEIWRTRRQAAKAY